ncbi:MAG: hypothetical protein QF681_13395 [Vicinamibacterales bacterium]|jgi:hypothetical protein|nr:hypothetical protein [Vicinamibacterales bacterium]
MAWTAGDAFARVTPHLASEGLFAAAQHLIAVTKDRRSSPSGMLINIPATRGLETFTPLQSGTTLGPYSVAAKIGEGGMGEVFRACDAQIDRQDCFVRRSHGNSE